MKKQIDFTIPLIAAIILLCVFLSSCNSKLYVQDYVIKDGKRVAIGNLKPFTPTSLDTLHFIVKK